MSSRSIVAGFKCPICNSDVKAHGFVWRCINKENCSFSMGRRWKRDPRGMRWKPDQRYYTGSRERYIKKHGSLANLRFERDQDGGGHVR